MLKQWQVCGVLLLIGSQASAAVEKITLLISVTDSILCVVCAAGGMGGCYGSVKCVGYLLLIGSQASAAAEHAAFVDFSHIWDSLVFGKLCHSGWLCGLKSLPQIHAVLRT